MENKKESKLDITIIPEPAISCMKDNVEMFRIEQSGKVFWKKDGHKMVQAKIDKDLAQVFAYAIVVMTGMDSKEYIKKIVEEYETRTNKTRS